MKRSENGCVSDRPPTPMTCPDTRHRSSTGAVGVSSAQTDALQTGSDTRAAPIPLPHRRRALRHCRGGRPRQDGDQRLPKPSTIVGAFVDGVGMLDNRCRTGDVDGLHVRTADGRRHSHPLDHFLPNPGDHDAARLIATALLHSDSYREAAPDTLVLLPSDCSTRSDGTGLRDPDIGHASRSKAPYGAAALVPAVPRVRNPLSHLAVVDPTRWCAVHCEPSPVCGTGRAMCAGESNPCACPRRARRGPDYPPALGVVHASTSAT
jgi:hypothetical protein